MSNSVSTLIPRKIAKQRLGGVSDMTIWRLERNSKSGFPLPVFINGRCYYEAEEFAASLSSRPRKVLSKVA
jgi:hypothetical protein